MTTTEIISLTAICIAFAVFAVVLFWGDYQTRNIRHAGQTKPQAAPPAKPQAAAAKAAEPVH